MEFDFDDELDLWELHQEQREKSPPPSYLRVVDHSSKQERHTRMPSSELQALVKSGEWVVRGQGVEEGEFVVHVARAAPSARRLG